MEIQRILAMEAPVAKDWLYSPQNLPFGPMCTLNASQLGVLPFHEAREIMKSVAEAAVISFAEVDFEDQSTAKELGGRRRSSFKGYQSM